MHLVQVEILPRAANVRFQDSVCALPSFPHLASEIFDSDWRVGQGTIDSMRDANPPPTLLFPCVLLGERTSMRL